MALNAALRSASPVQLRCPGVSIVVFGAGAVGATIGGWLTPHHPGTWLVDLPAVAQALTDKWFNPLLCSDDAVSGEAAREGAATGVEIHPSARRGASLY